MAIEMSAFKATAVKSYNAVRDYLGKTPERKWTAAGIALAFGLSLIFMPGFGIAAFGGAISAWGFGIFVFTIFGALVGNRAGIEVQKRRSMSQPPIEPGK